MSWGVFVCAGSLFLLAFAVRQASPRLRLRLARGVSLFCSPLRFGKPQPGYAFASLVMSTQQPDRAGRKVRGASGDGAALEQTNSKQKTILTFPAHPCENRDLKRLGEIPACAGMSEPVMRMMSAQQPDRAGRRGLAVRRDQPRAPQPKPTPLSAALIKELCGAKGNIMEGEEIIALIIGGVIDQFIRWKTGFDGSQFRPRQAI